MPCQSELNKIRYAPLRVMSMYYLFSNLKLVTHQLGESTVPLSWSFVKNVPNIVNAVNFKQTVPTRVLILPQNFYFTFYLCSKGAICIKNLFCEIFLKIINL